MTVIWHVIYENEIFIFHILNSHVMKLHDDHSFNRVMVKRIREWSVQDY